MIEYLNFCVTDKNNNSFFVTLHLSEDDTYLVETKTGKGGVFVYSPEEHMNFNMRIVGELADASGISEVFERLCIRPLKGKKRFPPEFELVDRVMGNLPDEFILDYSRVGKTYTHHIRGNTSSMPDSLLTMLHLFAGWEIIDKELIDFTKETIDMREELHEQVESNSIEDEFVEVDIDDILSDIDEVDFSDFEELSDEVDVATIVAKAQNKLDEINAALDEISKDREIKPYEFMSIAALAYSDMLDASDNIERVSIFKQFLSDFLKDIDRHTPLISFDSDDLVNNIVRIGSYVDDNKLTELMNANLSEDEFYASLVEFICSDEVIAEDKINGVCALYSIANDIRIPYCQIEVDETVHISQNQYNATISNMIDRDLVMVDRLLLYPHTHSYDCASELLAHIEKHENVYERIALLSRAIQHFEVRIINVTALAEAYKRMNEINKGDDKNE